MTWGEIRAEIATLAPGKGNDQLARWIARVYREILDRRDWVGLHQPGTLQLVAAYSAGTVALTNGSMAVVGTSTIFTPAMTGRKFRVIAGEEWYTFTYLSATSGTLDRAYEGTTDAAAGYTIYQDRYTLPAQVKIVEHVGGEPPITIDELRGQFFTTGKPQFWALAEDTDEASPGGVLHTVELRPAPDVAMSLPYRYLISVFEFDGYNTSDSPLPWVSADAIVAGVLQRAGVQDSSEFDRFVALMERQDNQRIAPTQMQMAERFTAHRRRRM